LTDRHAHHPLRIATALTAVALGLVGFGLAGSGSADIGEERVLGQSTRATTADPTPTPTAEETEAAAFLDMINQLRLERSVDPLRPDPELELISTAWAARMSQTGVLSHTDDLSLGVSADWRKLGENVGVAPEQQFEELFEAFVASPTHLANLVDPAFDLVGIGIVHADGKLWMTQRFMDLSPADAGVELG
jgi:uncharacterized protein YkwD